MRVKIKKSRSGKGYYFTYIKRTKNKTQVITENFTTLKKAQSRAKKLK